MKTLRLIMIIAVMMFAVATTTGCMEKMSGQIDMHEVNYALYGPHETDISME
ncbi:MAG: hypothetical protein JW837_16050 [Sedimentisphaerales bacterium]|nr:hypothetical protein [Sedimentisphaerales bacterium]